ncbi:MAG: hypothetical protein HYX33_02810, partial [Actinobacteria bacterium]|nr:hypothetical protein [Actinomycetota bacterium]
MTPPRRLAVLAQVCLLAFGVATGLGVGVPPPIQANPAVGAPVARSAAPVATARANASAWPDGLLSSDRRPALPTVEGVGRATHTPIPGQPAESWGSGGAVFGVTLVLGMLIAWLRSR